MENKITIEGIIEKAKAIKAKRDYVAETERFINSEESLIDAEDEIRRIFATLEERSKDVSDKSGLSIRVSKKNDECRLHLFDSWKVEFSWTKKYADRVRDSNLVVALSDSGGRKKRTTGYSFTKNRSGVVGWQQKDEGKFRDSNELVLYWIDMLLDSADEQES